MCAILELNGPLYTDDNVLSQKINGEYLERTFFIELEIKDPPQIQLSLLISYI